MNKRFNHSEEQLLERLSGLTAAAVPPVMDPGLEAKLLKKLGRRPCPLRFSWDLLLLALLLASLAWDLERIASHIFR